MTETKAVFFDGIPGSGKSTLTYWLGELRSSREVECTVYDEVCTDHPVRIYDLIYTDFTDMRQSAEFRSRTIALYRKFVKKVSGTNDVTIFDGWLFQATIGFTFLLRMEMSTATDFAFELFDILSPLNPHIVYIAQKDVERNWRRLCGIRGETFSKGRCDFSSDFDYVKAGIAWSANQEFCLSLLRNSGLRHLIVENRDYDYASQRTLIEGFLEM